MTPADGVAPSLQYAAGLSSFDKVRLWFSEPLDPTIVGVGAADFYLASARTEDDAATVPSAA